MVVSSPAIVNGVVYIGSYDHIVYALGSSPSTQTYSVSFTQSGLPSGTSWNVTFNAETKSATSDSIVFNVANGVYTFSITPPAGYDVSPSSGLITVNFADVNQQVTFTSPMLEFSSIIGLSLFIAIVILVAALLAIALHRRKNRV
jgi:hypothetical protein